ncbi:PREDICTED: uncharacterized protein LOC109176441 isoform X1 [Ipomoea nil]|uniref:uncharacterized protein LOC109176441 isoform X1 n=1 Tax=Ipomoea nil TaxID=35883 RepID=UPI000900D4C0|nr:PREDICTED: uncharacterized protein LOC109176441 isoform X1 [Ipomoea nil]
MKSIIQSPTSITKRTNRHRRGMSALAKTEEAAFLASLSAEPSDRRETEDTPQGGMGFNPWRYKFLLVVHAFRAMSKETWEKKMGAYKKYEFYEAEIFKAFEVVYRKIGSSLLIMTCI